MERILRISTILVILFVALGWSKPNIDIIDDFLDDEDMSDDEYYQSENNTAGSQNNTNPPEMKSQPVNITVILGDNIVLPCEVKNTDSVLVLWMKNNETLYSDWTPFTMEPSRIKKVKNSLIIYNASASDASDNYVCQLTTEPVTEIVHRVVVEPEVTLIPSKHTVVNIGEDVELECKFNRKPNIDIKWSYKGVRLPVGDESVHGNTIMIHNVKKDHAGHYQCLTNDHTKTPLHDFIELVVNYPPEIEVEQESVHTGTGKDSQLTCIVHAHPRADVTWFKNKKLIDSKNRIFIKNTDSKHTLVLKHTMKDDFATYTCQASNALGTTSRNIYLTGVPTKASFSGAEFGDDNSTLVLKWRLRSFSPITEYKLQYRREGESSWINKTPRVIDGQGAGETIYTVEHLFKGLESGEYEVTLIAKNDYGWSPKELVTFRGEYVSDNNDTQSGTGSAVTSRPLLGFTSFLLVFISYISFTNL